METQRTGSSRATLIRIPALLGLLVCCQAVWSQTISISPSPSYNGNYTVSFGVPLGCYVEEDPFGFTLEYCRTLIEYVGDTPVGSWDAPQGSTSKNFTDKYSNTYTYRVYYQYWHFSGNGSSYSNPTSVQVIRPIPDPNTYSIPIGPGNNPSGYRLGWAATQSNTCDLNLEWHLSSGLNPADVDSYVGLATTFEGTVDKRYSNTDFVWATVTCHGPGGSAAESLRLEFNQNP